MTAICIKTGADIYVEEYGRYVHGDLHADSGVLMVRTCSQPIEKPPVRHATVHKVSQWFDANKDYGTLISLEFTDHGYEGIPNG